MKVLLKQAKIIDSTSEFHNKKKDILIENGRIIKIDDKLNKEGESQVIESEDLHVSKGWIDLKAHFCDPGHEYKETIQSGLDKAAKGGFTQVAVLPSTSPVMDQKASIDSILRKAEGHAVAVIPMGCLTKGMKGKELAELFDMQKAGALLFTDDRVATEAGVLSNALMYAQNFNARITVSVGNASLTKNAQVNEGQASLKTGLKGDPEVSEIIEIERHLRILDYTKGTLHISGVSTIEGVNLIREAKKKGLLVSADTHIMNLCFDESKVLDFDTRFKTHPPLRNNKNNKALWLALKEGVIDCVVSNHRPTDQDEKEVDFESAEFGAPHLQTLFAALNTANNLSTNELIEVLAEKPAKLLEIQTTGIKVDTMANLTIFDPSLNFDTNTLSKKDKAFSPFDLGKLKGLVIGIIKKGNQKMNI